MTKINSSSEVNRPDDLLLSGEVDVLVCSFHSDHRPIQGTAALMDWRLKGMISRFLKIGRITGDKSEIVYIPVRHGAAGALLPETGSSPAVVLVGCGRSDVPLLPTENKALLETVRGQLLKLRKKKVAVSQSSFPNMEPAQIRKALGEKEFEVVLTT